MNKEAIEMLETELTFAKSEEDKCQAIIDYFSVYPMERLALNIAKHHGFTVDQINALIMDKPKWLHYTLG